MSPWRRSVCVGIIAASAFTAGCATHQYATPEEAIKNACSAIGPKALSGALIGALVGAGGGAAIGAAAGSGGHDAAVGALAGLIVGTVAGVVAGSHVDKQDCEEAQKALQAMSTSSTGTRVVWNNTATGSGGAFTAVSDAKEVNGRVCREIRADYWIKNNRNVSDEEGLVCRTSAADWARVKNPS